MSEISEELKAIFREQAEWRKAHGYERRLFSIYIEKNLHRGIEEMWLEWKELLGADRAAIFLQHCMMRYSEVLRQVKEQQDKKREKR